ncbi:MAG TPA: hypothetical protein VEH07_03740, partial [Alphaproteobacteria bacterium]|nr:hypothetical protein [Alphaproteobacteria bacterium]
LAALRLRGWLQDGVAQGSIGARLIALRVLQLAPSVAIVFAIAGAAQPVARHYGDKIAAAGNAVIDTCSSIAQSVEGVRFTRASLCLGGPSCR